MHCGVLNSSADSGPLGFSINPLSCGNQMHLYTRPNVPGAGTELFPLKTTSLQECVSCHKNYNTHHFNYLTSLKFRIHTDYPCGCFSLTHMRMNNLTAPGRAQMALPCLRCPFLHPKRNRKFSELNFRTSKSPSESPKYWGVCAKFQRRIW